MENEFICNEELRDNMYQITEVISGHLNPRSFVENLKLFSNLQIWSFSAKLRT